MRRLALAAVLSLAALAPQAAPALAGGGQPTSNTIVIDDSNPATVTITATGFSQGLVLNDTPLTTILAPGQIGPVSITLPDASNTSDAPFYMLSAILGNVAANLPEELAGVSFFLGGPNNITSAFVLYTAGSDDTGTAQIMVEFIPSTGAIFGGPGDVAQDGHQEIRTLLNSALTVTFISEAPERAPIPEPATLALLGAGLLGLGAARHTTRHPRA